MPGRPLAALIHQAGGPEPTDADLLHRYAADRDPVAFEALVRRHGPAVFGACRRVLRQPADAEDAFQATFLLLARRPAAVRDRSSVGGWLFGVALNIARRADRADRRRRHHEQAVARPASAPCPDPSPDESVVLDELARLPDRYRGPLVACGLDGQTVRQAAAALGLPPGTVSTRVARGRALLARRLARRGIPVPAVLVTAPVSAELITRTAALAGDAPVPAAVLALTREVSRAMLIAKLKAGLVVLLLIAGAGLTGVGLLRAGAAAPPPAAREPTAAKKLIDRLKELKPKGRGEALTDESAAVLRDLVRLGPAAVPDVIAELDAADDGFLLRCLGFAARAIGDKRAVPALIRALPKACRPPGSDYGLVCNDPELLAFLQKHSAGNLRTGRHYSFGRPVNEFRAALQSLTGMKHGEDELIFANRQGSARQQALQVGVFHRVAEQWAGWWEGGGNKAVADPRHAKVGLPPRPPVPTGRPVAGFPSGPEWVPGRQKSNCLIESVRAAAGRAVFVDLDTGRHAALPDRLRSPAGRPERTDDIAAWAAEEGFDLMGTEYLAADGGRPHYVIRGLGLSAWPVDAGRRRTLDAEFRAGNPLHTDPPTNGLLARFDPATARYVAADPALFLFRTREEGYGWLFVGVEVHDDRLEAGGVSAEDDELNPVAFRKGRRYAYTLLAEAEAK